MTPENETKVNDRLKELEASTACNWAVTIFSVVLLAVGGCYTLKHADKIGKLEDDVTFCRRNYTELRQAKHEIPLPNRLGDLEMPVAVSAQATLPVSLEQQQVKDMRIGQTMVAETFQLSSDQGKYLWLAKDAEVKNISESKELMPYLLIYRESEKEFSVKICGKGITHSSTYSHASMRNKEGIEYFRVIKCQLIPFDPSPAHAAGEKALPVGVAR